MGFHDTGTENLKPHIRSFISCPTSIQLLSRIPRFFFINLLSLTHIKSDPWFYNNWHWINLPRKTMLQRVQCALTKKIMGVKMQIWVASQFWIARSLTVKRGMHHTLQVLLSEFNTWIYKFYSQILERQFPLKGKKRHTHLYTEKQKQVLKSPFQGLLLLSQNFTTTFIHYWMCSQIVSIINSSYSLDLL